MRVIKKSDEQGRIHATILYPEVGSDAMMKSLIERRGAAAEVTINGSIIYPYYDAPNRAITYSEIDIPTETLVEVRDRFRNKYDDLKMLKEDIRILKEAGEIS